MKQGYKNNIDIFRSKAEKTERQNYQGRQRLPYPLEVKAIAKKVSCIQHVAGEVPREASGVLVDEKGKREQEDCAD